MKNNFRKISLLLVFTLLFSFVAPVCYADNTLTDEEFLSELKGVVNEASFLNFISENVSFVEGLDTYTYYKDSNEIKQETARLFILNKTEYNEINDFQRDFEVYVLLARVNTASYWGIIHETINMYKDRLGLDFTRYSYLSNNKQEVAVLLFHGCRPFVSAADFKIKFDHAVANVKEKEDNQSPSTPSSPSPGVGGVSSSRAFNCKVVSSDGTAFTSQPENGTEVKLIIETSVILLDTLFIVAVYENDNTLKSVKTFNITATDADSLETLELITEYDADGIIKLFNVYDMTSLKPVTHSISTDFSGYNSAE